MKKNLFILGIMTLLSFNLCAQGGFMDGNGNKAKVDLAGACSNPHQIFMVTEKSAELKDGRKNLIRLLNEQTELNRKARGQMFLSFLINCKGEASGFIAIKADDQEIAKRAIEALNKIQGWNAAQQKNKPVDSYKMLNLEYKKGRFF